MKNGTTKKATKKSAKKFKGDVEIRDVYEQELTRPVDNALALKKQARIVEALTEKVRLKEEIRPAQNEIANRTKEVERLRKEIKDRSETVFVKCREEYNYKARKIQIRRMDTKKLVKELEEDMTDEDRQLGIDDVTDKKAKAEQKAGEKAHEEAMAGEDVPEVAPGETEDESEGSSLTEN